MSDRSPKISEGVPDGTWVVVAAFNEATVIADTVRGLLTAFSHVAVIDDGSCDETARNARNAGAYVASHPINLGQGAALQTGITLALSRDARWIVTFDADGQHRVDDAVRLVSMLSDGTLDIVCGSRFLGSAPNMPFARKMLVKAAVLFTWATTGIRMTDAHNGLRAFSAEAARRIRIRQDRMAHASELIAEIRRKRLRFAEAPVSIVYTDYSLAKGQRLLNSLNIVFDLLSGKLNK